MIFDYEHKNIDGGCRYRVWYQKHPDILALPERPTPEQREAAIVKALIWERTVLIKDCHEQFIPPGIASPEFGKAYDQMLEIAQLKVPGQRDYYSAETLAGEPICQQITNETDCVKLVKEYQRAHGNPMCKVFVHRVVRTHHTLVEPNYGATADPRPESPSPGQPLPGDPETRPLPPVTGPEGSGDEQRSVEQAVPLPPRQEG